MPELLSKPLREEADDEVAELAGLLGRLGLCPVDRAVAELATVLGATYRLRAAAAGHLATAVAVGAERFVTDNLSRVHEIEGGDRGDLSGDLPSAVVLQTRVSV